jgi:DNA-binding response OmpR family regulator
MLQKVLEHAGYEVETASNGKTGLKLYRENPSDLIITDLVMPEKEGLETIMELRRTTPSVKILAISGGGRLKPHVNLVMAEKLGAAKSVAKPFSHQEILDAVAEILKRGEK